MIIKVDESNWNEITSSISRCDENPLDLDKVFNKLTDKRKKEFNKMLKLLKKDMAWGVFVLNDNALNDWNKWGFGLFMKPEFQRKYGIMTQACGYCFIQDIRIQELTNKGIDAEKMIDDILNKITKATEKDKLIEELRREYKL